jgi:Holliday junction resolvase
VPQLALRRDDNEKEIVDALVSGGCSVHRLNGPGLPDLLVSRARKNYLLEVKKIKGGKLTKVQVYWHKVWRGLVHIVRTPDDALRAVELIK